MRLEAGSWKLEARNRPGGVSSQSRRSFFLLPTSYFLLPTPRLRPRSGQALIEYAFGIALVIAAVIGMFMPMKRGLQAAVKASADGLSPYQATRITGDPGGEEAQLVGLRYESGDREIAANEVVANMVLKRESAVQTVTTTIANRGELAGGVIEKNRPRPGATPVYGETTITTPILAGYGENASSHSEVVMDTP